MGNKDVWGYYRDIDFLKPHVKKAFVSLQKEYECIVAEGAGSPVELNLMDKDLSNIYVAQEFKTKIVLVADIQRGGVFASIYSPETNPEIFAPLILPAGTTMEHRQNYIFTGYFR